MSIKITSRDIKFFVLGAAAVFIFLLIYDWDHFEKGLLGKLPHDHVRTEKVE